MQLGEYDLDLEGGTLIHRSRGLVPMRPQAWSVLALLARNAGKVVTKAQMLDTVWPSLVVTDASLVQAISDVRAVLGEEGHALIKTVARRGYLLVNGHETGTHTQSTNVQLAIDPLSVPANSMRLFGREPELHLLRNTLIEHRLVTVLGAGGIGKTVLARAAARAHLEDRSNGVAWVDLAPITEVVLLPATLARALGLPISHGENPLAGLLAALRLFECLLVLDNAEHLVEAIAPIATAILKCAPGVHLLVTSQAPLLLESERLFRLKPLHVPRANEPLAQARLAASVALFEDRAIAVDRDFTLTKANVGTVIRICKRLDGLPLAIRLAASRTPVLGLSALEAHLDDRLVWIGSEHRDLPSRQQTLLAALQWSYGLLTTAEQRLSRQLGVFVGGFTFELAIAMARGPGVDDGQILAQFHNLVERSLIDREPGDPPRFRMLESQRALALQELSNRSELRDAQHRHARILLDAMQQGAPASALIPDEIWVPKLMPELDNLRAAIRWSARSEPRLSASLVWSSHVLFMLLDLGPGLLRESGAIDMRAIADLDADLASRLYLARAGLEQRSAARRWEYAALAERWARQGANPRILYSALCLKIAGTDIQPQDAAAAIGEIASLESPGWPPRVRCMGCWALYAVETLAHRWPQALQAAETGLEVAIQAGTTIFKAGFGTAVLLTLIRSGDLDTALRRSASIRQHVVAGPAITVVPYIGACAQLRVLRGDLAVARDLLAEVFELCRAVEWSYFDTFCTVYLRLALMERRLESAARLVAYAEQVAATYWVVSDLRNLAGAAHASLAAKIDPMRLEALYAEGAKLEPEEVCRLTLGRE